LPDHLPIIGASPLHPGAFFAFGHQHLGLTLAGVTADVLAALIGDGEPPVDITPFRIDRF
jgi:D-amino-acid dehydrogenase